MLEGITPEDLQQFEDQGYSEEDAIALAQGLLELAIPCLEGVYETLKESTKKAIKFGLLEMAHYLRINFHNFANMTSPFQSETLGSYSYSKMSSQVKTGEKTGVPAFDRAVELLRPLCEDASRPTTGSTSEFVFKAGYDNYLQHRENLYQHRGW